MVRRLPQFERQVLQFQHPSVTDAAGLEMRVLVAVKNYAVKVDIHRTLVVLVEPGTEADMAQRLKPARLGVRESYGIARLPKGQTPH